MLQGAIAMTIDNPGPTPNPQPTVSSFTPNQVSKGQQNVEGRIQGTNLGGVTAVNLEQDSR